MVQPQMCCPLPRLSCPSMHLMVRFNELFLIYFPSSLTAAVKEQTQRGRTGFSAQSGSFAVFPVFIFPDKRATVTTSFKPCKLFKCRYASMCLYIQDYTSSVVLLVRINQTLKTHLCIPQNIISLKRQFSFPWVLVNLIMSKMSQWRAISLEEV